jgi:isopropylmalate/homocitrate/citramalate synthase
MTIQEYIRKIHDVIQTEEEYEQYSYIFKEYIDYLESLLKKEPDNIKAVCQLAIAYYEDCRENEDIISLLEDA